MISGAVSYGGISDELSVLKKQLNSETKRKEAVMRRFDDLLSIDGEHTVLTGSRGQVEIVPASQIYSWNPRENAPAWPLHEDRGQTDSRHLQEHEAPPTLDPNVVGNSQWNPSNYEEAVQIQLERIFRRPRGCGAILRRYFTKQVTIMPFPIRDPVNQAGNYRPNAAPRARASDRSLYIIYTPGHFPPEFRASSLFHELVHVYRIMSGVYRPRAAARDYERYTRWEEFPAVCLENVFRSEHMLPLRWGHFDVTTPLRNQDTWLDNTHNRRAVERLMREMPELTAGLASVDARFNPFRQISRERR